MRPSIPAKTGWLANRTGMIMEELDRIWNSRSFEQSRSYNRSLALTLQPCSYADFNTHSDFENAFDLWTQRDLFRGLDLGRLWSLVLNLKHTLKNCSGALAEVGVYQG